MKQGFESVMDLARAVQEADAKAKDYTASFGDLRFQPPQGEEPARVMFNPGGGAVSELSLTRRAHMNVAERLEIPQRFYDRLLNDHPDQWQGVTQRLADTTPKAVMLRTMDSNLRALLSASYRRMDNWPVLREVAGMLSDLDGAEIVSSNVSEARMYIKIVGPKKNAVEVMRGDWVRTGIVISNSEVGEGAFAVRGFAERLVCTNGMVLPSDITGIRRTHLGKALARPGDSSRELILAEDTVAAEAHALALAARDVVAAMFAPDWQQTFAARLREAAGDVVTGQVAPAVAELGRTLSLTEQETANVLESLLRAGGEPTRYTLIQAVTDASKKAPDYDRATEMEAAGGKLLVLHPRQWRTIATAEAVAA